MANQVNIAGATSGNFIKLDNVVLDVWSREILFKAQPVLKFESICTIQNELGATPGTTIKFLKYNPLTGKSNIAETTPIEAQAMSTATVSLTVTEHAKATSMSELLLRAAADRELDRAASLLGRHYASDRDRMVRDTLLTVANVLWAKGRSSRAGLVVADVFDVNLIRDAVEQLATNKAPKFGADAYICFVHPHQSRALRADTAWINASNYGQPDQIFTGEIGRIEDVRFIETTNITYIKKGATNIWADSIDTGDTTAIAINTITDVYQAIIVGEYCVGLAEALPVELRDNGVQDYGRTHSLAYYGIWGTGLIEPGHGFILETA